MNYACLKIATLLLTFLPGGSVISSELPAAWTDEMTLTLEHYGGKNPLNNKVQISKTGFQKISKAGTEEKTTLSFSQEELDQLLRFLNEKRFNSLKSVKRQALAHDKPTTRMTLLWGENKHILTSSGSEEIRTADKENYLEINKYINALLNKKNVVWP